MKISELSADTFWKGEVRVTALVADGEEQYKVKIYVKGSQVFDYSCSCAQGNSFRGMCAHGRAVFEEYKKKKELTEQAVATSQGARFMIREITDRRMAAARAAGGEKKVSLEMQLSLAGRDVSVRFLVGKDRMYRVKDLAGFADAVRHGRVVEYGKELSFFHWEEAFEEEARPLLRLILEHVSVREHYFRQFSHSSFASLAASGEMELTAAETDRVMEMFENRTVSLSVPGDGGRGRAMLVCRQDPALCVPVRRAGRDGVKVELPENWFVFFGERGMYLADGTFIYMCSGAYRRGMEVFLKHMLFTYGASRKMTVNDRDMPQFYEAVLQPMERLGALDAGDVELLAYRAAPMEPEFYFSSPAPDTVRMEIRIRYGDKWFCPVTESEGFLREGAASGSAGELPVVRDRAGEIRVEQTALKYFKHRGEDGSLMICGDEEALYRLLEAGMEEFMALGRVELSEEFKRMRVLPPPPVSLGVSLSGGWLDLKVEAGGLTASELKAILGGYRQKKSYYRMKNGDFLRLGDDGLMTVARLMDGLSLDEDEMRDGRLRLPKNRAMYLDSVMKEGNGISYYRDNLFKAVIRGMKSVEDGFDPVPAQLAGVLRGYQKTGFRWMRTLDRWGFGGILADDMGIGKTIQVLALLASEAERAAAGEPGEDFKEAALGGDGAPTPMGETGEAQKHQPSASFGRLPSLVVCPASLVYNWESEIERFAPQLSFCVVDGTSEGRREIIGRASEYDLLVTSYDLLKRDLDVYSGILFRYQIADEAQFIKNAATQTARAVKSIRAVTKFALTGTPVENRLGELWSIFDYLMPGFLWGYQRFKKVFENPIVRGENKEALDHLRKLTAPFILRRLKGDVLKDLPDKLETVVYSRLGETQGQLYAAAAMKLKEHLAQTRDEEYAGQRMEILAELLRLRQICCDPSLCYENYAGGAAKLETCMQLVSDAVEGGHKLLIFSQFTSMLEIIGRRLSREGIAFHRLVGATPKEERAALAEAFGRDEVPVFLISLKAGGTGLNLTAADVVIHFDPWWNAAAQNQATDRAHRIGQKRQVTVFKLIAKNTVEENILLLQESKRLLADQVVQEGMASLNGLSRKDLMALL